MLFCFKGIKSADLFPKNVPFCRPTEFLAWQFDVLYIPPTSTSGLFLKISSKEGASNDKLIVLRP